MSTLASDVRVIDADTHLTEAHDLWTSRAPAAYRDRVPQVVEVDGWPTWVVDGTPLGFAGGGGMIDRDDEKYPFAESMIVWGIDRIHEAADNPEVRLQVMDACGIHAQVLFPNSDASTAGVGYRRVRPGGRAGGRPRPAGGQQDLRPPGPRLSRPGQPGMGPAVGGVRRPGLPVHFHILFETDFPHPTRLYPSSLDTIEEKMLTLRPETRRKVRARTQPASTASDQPIWTSQPAQ